MTTHSATAVRFATAAGPRGPARTARARLAVAVAVALAAAGASPRTAVAGKGGGSAGGGGAGDVGPGIAGAKVARGAASFAQAGSTTVITASNRAVIDYARFDVPAGTGVKFVQPSAAATVLNRINGGSPSRVDGTLTANGRVFFVNPTGVVFGPDAQVRAAGFTAAAANLSNDDFLRGVYRFTGAAGSVVNEGTIAAAPGGAVNLFGKQVVNAGTIAAPNGLVSMTAGSGVTYVGEAAGAGGGGASVAVKVDPAAGPVGPAAGASGDVFSLAIRRGGVARAKDVVVKAAPGAGFVKVEGTLDASAATGKGGTVTVAGDRVGLLGATVDASGPAGGGAVRVGGDYQGGGDLPHAQFAVVDAASTVRADATVKGDGGSVVVWSDADTRFRGTASARGGPAGGDGGLVETSGGHLDTAGATVRVDAPGGGAGGTWLLDPTVIVIRSAARFAERTGMHLDQNAGPLVTALTDADLLSPGVQYRPDASLPVSRLTTEAIAAQLNQGVSVTIDASVGPRDLLADTATGAIFLNDLIVKSQVSPAEAAGGAAPTLTFNAPRLIRFNGTSAETLGVAPNTTLVARNDFGGINTTGGKLNVVMQVRDDLGSALSFNSRYGQMAMTGDGVRTNGGSFTARVVDAAGTPIVQPAPDQPAPVGRTERQLNQFVTAPNDPAFLTKNNLPDARVGDGGLIDTRGPAGTRGGDVTIDVPRAVAMLSPVFTGGGDVRITTSGPIGADQPSAPAPGPQITSSPIVIPGAISTAGGGPTVPGGNVTIRSTFDVQVRSIGTGGGNIAIAADTIKTGQLSGDPTDPTATVVRRDANARGKVTLLRQEVVNFPTSAERQADPAGLDAGDGTVSATGFQVLLSNNVIGRGGVSLLGDLRDRTGAFAANANGVTPDGPISQFVGLIDGGSSPVTLRGGRVIVLAGSGIRGGDITIDSLFPNADPAKLSGADISSVVVASPNYSITTTGGTVRVVPGVLAVNQLRTGNGPTSAINPTLTVAAEPGASAEVTFERSVGGPLRLVVDAGPDGKATFGDAVGRIPQLINAPTGGKQYVMAPYGVTALDVRAAGVQFGQRTAAGGDDTPPSYNGLTLPEGGAARDGSLFARKEPGSTGDVLVTGAIKLRADRIVAQGESPQIVSGNRIEAKSTPVDRAGGVVPVFASPGGAADASDRLVGGFDLEGSSVRVVTDPETKLPVTNTITPSNGGASFTINPAQTAPPLTVPATPRLTATLTPLVVQTEFAPQSVAEVIAGATPPVIRRADRAAAPTGSQVAELVNLGINARAARLEAEVMDAALTGRASYDDFDNAMALGYPIAAPRISAAQASFALTEYKALRAELKPRQDALSAEWEKYQAVNEGKEVTGAGFRRYLESAKGPTANQARAVETLRRLQRLQEELALNPVYRAKAEKAIASAFRPDAIPLVQFRAAITGVDPATVGSAE